MESKSNKEGAGLFKGSTVMVVDDQGTSRAILGHMLHTSLGCSVVSFDNPLEALKWAEEHHFDIGVIDYRMPQMNGFKLAERLHEICPSCRIILITAYELSQLPDAATARDVAICLPKSQGMDAIVERCRALL